MELGQGWTRSGRVAATLGATDCYGRWQDVAKQLALLERQTEEVLLVGCLGVLRRCPEHFEGDSAVGELVQEPAGQAERDLLELLSLLLAPGEEPPHLVGVGGPGVRIGEPSPKELVRSEAGRLAGSHEDGRKSPFEVVFRQRIGVGRDEFLNHHK